jgi:hypothetical protein
MSISRRFFLIGSGAVVTSAFVKHAVRFVDRNSRPFLIQPDRVETELFYYEMPDGGASITLGEWRDIEDIAAPRTWREYYTKIEGRDLSKQAQMDRIWKEQLDEHMPEDSWQNAWDHEWSPHARAYKLLQALDLGPLRKRAGLRMWKGQLFFEESLRPFDHSRIVNAEGPTNVIDAALKVAIISPVAGSQQSRPLLPHSFFTWPRVATNVLQ